MKIASFLPPPPLPTEDERPAAYAERVGRILANHTTAEHKKRFGQYLTPLTVADFMAQSCARGGNRLRVLDPGAGVGVLSCALCETLAARRGTPLEIELVAYEHDARLTAHLTRCLEYAKRWLEERNTLLRYEVRAEDFVLAHAQALNSLPRLFPGGKNAGERFDLIISNPPYFKIAKSDPRARAAAAVVHGQPNIYALFMAVSASLLSSGGELAFIIPRSFAAGPYFRLFREHFFNLMRPRAVHLFGSRREAFGRDEVLQENIILLARRADGWPATHNGGTVEVSFSEGVRDLAARRRRKLPLAEVLNFHSRDRVLRVPATDGDEEIARAVRAWPGSLSAYGLEVSTGPVVPFRAAAVLSKGGAVPKTHAPLLWMQNVTPMRVAWPAAAKGKAQYIEVKEHSLPLLVPNRNYVLMRRFSAKEAPRRLIAAPLLAAALMTPLVGLENHLNYVHRPGGSLSEHEAYGLAALFNNSLLDAYFRSSNGNTQVSATEIRALPLPPLDLIEEIGRRVEASSRDADQVEALVTDLLDLSRRGAATETAHA